MKIYKNNQNSNPKWNRSTTQELNLDPNSILPTLNIGIIYSLTPKLLKEYSKTHSHMKNIHAWKSIIHTYISTYIHMYIHTFICVCVDVCIMIQI